MYPEFAYTKAMQLILAIVASSINFIVVYLIANLILLVYGERAGVRQKSTFAFLIGIILNTAWSYAVYFSVGVQSFSPTVYSFVVNPNPIFALLYYLIGIKVLKLSPVRSIKLMGYVYMYYMLIKSLVPMLASIFFVQQPGRYNYLLDVFKNLVIFVVFTGILFATKIALQYNKKVIKLRDNVFINLKKELVIYTVKSTIIYFLLVCVPLFFQEKIVINLVIFIVFVLLFSFFILWDMYIYKKNDVENKNAHIGILLKGILTEHDGDISEITRRMNENPSFLSILVNKCIYAEKMKVKMSVALKSRLDDLYIDNVDACIVVACLLDNAIEAAAVSQQKIVSFAIGAMDYAGKLIIINNSTDAPVDTDKILNQSIKSKYDHHSKGLATVRNIISKYGNCAFQLTYNSNSVSAYFQLKQN